MVLSRLPVHHDQLQAQRSVTSTLELFLFGVVCARCAAVQVYAVSHDGAAGDVKGSRSSAAAASVHLASSFV